MPMSARKKLLDTSPFDDIHILGITTTLPDYKLAWHINNKLQINLVKYDDIVPNELDGEYAYAFYLFDQGENSNIFNLVSINDKGARWLKLPVTTDFLFLIRNSIEAERLSHILKTIRKIEQLVHAFVIEQARIKGMDPLLEQIELHEMEMMKNVNKRLSRK